MLFNHPNAPFTSFHHFSQIQLMRNGSGGVWGGTGSRKEHLLPEDQEGVGSGVGGCFGGTSSCHKDKLTEGSRTILKRLFERHHGIG